MFRYSTGIPVQCLLYDIMNTQTAWFPYTTKKFCCLMEQTDNLFYFFSDGKPQLKAYFKARWCPKRKLEKQ